MHYGLANSIDPIARIWGNAHAWTYASCIPKRKIHNRNKARLVKKKIISKKGYQKGTFFTYI